MKGRSLFFFSSRRRHTRLQGDWSSDVCSSDLRASATVVAASVAVTCARSGLSPGRRAARANGASSSTRPRLGLGGAQRAGDRESGGEGKRGDLGGRRIIKKKKKKGREGGTRGA